MAQPNLVEVDGLEIEVIIDNELDPISYSTHPDVKHTARFQGINLSAINPPDSRAGAKKEMRMDHICCSAHGLSLMITATKGEKNHTLLFDTGPEEEAWERNARRLQSNIGSIEQIHLSHWHRDHSGGMLRAIRMINDAKPPSDNNRVVADLHPDRPIYRGVMPPNASAPISLEADPDFNEVVEAGAKLVRSDRPHSVLDGMFLVSGEIPRETGYETGIAGGMRFNPSTQSWENDPLIMDERFVMCNLKGKGLVLFTGCSHAGVINASRHALALGEGIPLYCVVGGYHLADAGPEKLQSTVEDLKKLEPKILIAGHCTGWRFKFEIEKAIPGSLVPSFVGTKYNLGG